jgi:hypothetical protein
VKAGFDGNGAIIDAETIQELNDLTFKRLLRTTLRLSVGRHKKRHNFQHSRHSLRSARSRKVLMWTLVFTLNFRFLQHLASLCGEIK